MPTFNMIVVGSGGGPDETNLSAYLVKPAEAPWVDGIVGLEAGSGQGALTRILEKNCDFWGDDEENLSAAEMYSYIRCYMITHAHLDHVNSLILSAGSSLDGQRRRIFAAEQSLKDLETVFSNRIWPKLASWDEHDDDFKYLYSRLVADSKYRPIASQLSARMMPLSHGRLIAEKPDEYVSSAFFIRHDPSAQEFLFFGDVEPDSLALVPRTMEVWRVAAPKIPDTLSTLFIECSWPSGRHDDMLHGHLSPEHLAVELTTLAMEVVKYRMTETKIPNGASPGPARKRQRRNPPPSIDLKGSLRGLRVYITHCKGCSKDTPRLILKQIRDVVSEKGLGADILLAEQGMRIDI